MTRNDDPDPDSVDADRLRRPDALDIAVNPRLIRLTGDSLASFGTETGADPRPAEPLADAPSQQLEVPPIPPRAGPPAPRSIPNVAPPHTAPGQLTRSPISKLILWPLLIAAAVFIGVSLGSMYARYVRPRPAAITERAPAGTEGGTRAVPEPVPDTGASKETSPPAPPADADVKPPSSSRGRRGPTVPATRPDRARPATIPPAVDAAADRSTATVAPPPIVTELPAVPLKTPAAVLPPSTAAPLPTVPATPPSTPPEKPAPGERERLTAANDQRAIRTILDAYRVAYEQRDTLAAARLWPGLDTRALTRAFSTLSSHRLTFDRCDVAVMGMQARADCDGTITYTPRVGDTQTQSRSMSWTFALDRSSGQWRISDVNAR